MRTVIDQGRALGDRTRHAILEHLARSPYPVEVRELTDTFGLHHSAVRAHLAKLRDAGLILAEQTKPRGRGRPARAYRLTPGALERWSHSAPYTVLTSMLLDLVEHGESPREVGRRTGKQLTRELIGTPTDAVDALEGVTRRMGYDIRRRGHPDDDRVDLVLGHCPFVDAAQRNPEVVCGLHRGLAEGVCEASGGSYRLVDLVIATPQDGGCRLELEQVEDAEST